MYSSTDPRQFTTGYEAPQDTESSDPLFDAILVIATADHSQQASSCGGG